MNENPARSFPELRAAEPWMNSRVESFARRWFHGDEDSVGRASRELLELLKVIYGEGYSDRMKSEVAEVRSETPKRTTRRRKK